MYVSLLKNISITSHFEIHNASQAIQDVAVNEQVVVAQLFGKGVSLEQNATLDGPKDSPYHVVGDDKKHTIVWGPFAEKKKIQVALYWTNSKGNGLQPIDKGEIKRFVVPSQLPVRSLNQLQLHVHSSPATSFAPK